MPYLTHYQHKLSQKIAVLKTVLLQETTEPHSPNFDLEILKTPEGINQLYEHFTIQFDKRIGIETSIAKTSSGLVFLRKQLDSIHRELAADSLAYRSEHYKIKALHSLKIAFDYIDLFVRDKKKQETLYKTAHNIFIHFQSQFDKEDGDRHIHQCLKNFNYAIHTIFHQQLHSRHYEQYFHKLNAWSQLNLPPHDVITVDMTDDTFEIIANASAPTEGLFLEMAMLSFWQQHYRYPDAKQLYQYLVKQNKATGLAEEDVIRFFDKNKTTLLDWYLSLSESDQHLIRYYANSFLNDFIVSPVQLSESSHGNKAPPFPSPLRNCHINLDGWIEKKPDRSNIHVSGAHLRSGAASRQGDIQTTLNNTTLLLSAVDSISQASHLSSAALLTDAITSLSKFRYLIGKEAEPDTKILDAYEQTESVFLDRMKLRVTSIIMKTFSDYYGRHVQRDPFKMMALFQSISFDAPPLTSHSSKEKNYAPDLKEAYQSVNRFVRAYYQPSTKDAFKTFICSFDEDQEVSAEHLRHLKKIYAQTKDVSLIPHIRLLESLYSYTILHLNKLKKTLFGTEASPVKETVLEYASPREHHKLADQHYHQWFLALETIIGYHLPLLNQFLPDDDEPIKAVMTNYYCKDGRDRTSLIATLIKTLNKMFDAQVSSLINKHSIIDQIDIPPLSMIPMTDLKSMTSLFQRTHDRVIDDFSSALLCGSPQSAMGDYGLLSKLFGAGYGIVSSSVPPIREGLKRITLPVAAEFSNPYVHKHGMWPSLSSHGKKHMDVSEDDERLLSLNKYVQKI